MALPGPSNARTKEKKLSWYSQSDFRGGINFEKEEATVNQLADARNVWCPNGVLEQRPGHKYVSTLLGHPANIGGRGAASASPTIIKYTASGGTYTDYLNGTGVTFAGTINDILYVGQSTSPITEDNDYTVKGISWGFSVAITANTAITRIKGQYWNGTAWVALDFVHTATIDSSVPVYCGKIAACLGGAPDLRFEYPKDIAQTSVNGTTRYWVRFIMTNASSTSTLINNETVYNTTPMLPMYKGAQDPVVLSGVAAVAFPGSNPRIVSILQSYDGQYSGSKGYYDLPTSTFITTGERSTTVPGIMVGSSILSPGERLGTFSRVQAPYTISLGVQAPQAITGDYSVTLLPEYGRALVTRAGVSFEFGITDIPIGTGAGDIGGYSALAAVESRTEFVGTNAPYSTALIPQAAAWPTAKYFVWNNSTLFGAGSADNPHEVRWSAPSTYDNIGYKIWPEVSRTTLLGGDLTPITGMAVFGEHPLVFKKESIWRLVNVGVSPEGLGLFEGVRIPGGVGCVSHNSIQALPVGLVYAYTDGVYIFDGQASQKISRPINKFWKTLNKNKATIWRSYHWKAKQCYLLAVSTPDDSTNKYVIVWDYEKNAWWIWDTLQVASFVDGHQGDELYYADKWGSFWQVVGTDDFGSAVDAWALTHRMGYKDDTNKNFRAASVLAANKLKTLSVSLIPQDADSYSTATVNFNDPAEPLPESFKFSKDRPTGKKLRARSAYFREGGVFVQAKIRNNTKNTRLEVSDISIGFIPQ